MGTVVFGYGNPGRGDDALGPAVASAIEDLRLPGVDVHSCYQLSVEDAWDLKAYDTAIFADAAMGGEEPFEWRELKPGDDAVFTSHAASPAGVLKLAERLFHAQVKGYVLGI